MLKRHRRLAALGAAVAALALVITGCSSGPGSDPSASDAGEPVVGGTLIRAVQGDSAGFDPSNTLLTPSSTYSSIALPVYDVLLTVDPEGEIAPRLAESITSDDQTVWTLTLREGVTFSDGTPFDAAAVVRNFERYQKPEANQTAAMHAATGFEAVDDLTVKITLDSANPEFPRALMGQSGMIVAPATLDAWEAGESPLPIGAGPFVMTEYMPKTSFSYERNDEYWDAPRPYLDAMQFNVIPDPAQGFNAFRAGEADIASYVPGSPVEWQDLKDNGTEVFETTQIGGNTFLFQNQKAPTDDVRVREALTLAVDLDDLNNQVNEGAEIMATTLFPEGNPYFNGEDLHQRTNDLEKAQELIDEYIAEQGDVTLEFPTSPTSAAYGVAIAQQLERLDGVTVNLDQGDTPHMLDRFYAGDFNIAFGTVKGTDPSEELADRLSCGASRNNGKFCNEEVDAALDEALASTDLAERAAAFRKVEEILWEQNPFILVSRLTVRTAIQDDVKGVTVFGGGDVDPAAIWLAQ